MVGSNHQSTVFETVAVPIQLMLFDFDMRCAFPQGSVNFWFTECLTPHMLSVSTTHILRPSQKPPFLL